MGEGSRDSKSHRTWAVLEGELIIIYQDPNSKVANILLALYHLSTTNQLPETSPEFAENYRRAINEYTQRAYKLDKDLPIACTTFASYFFSRKGMTNVETLAKKAIDYTDVNGVASDGYYLLARKFHYQGEHEKALMYYRKCNEARFEKPRGAAGEEKGYLPARVGIGQVQILMKGTFSTFILSKSSHSS